MLKKTDSIETEDFSVHLEEFTVSIESFKWADWR